MAGRRIGWAQVFLVLAGVCLMLAFAAIYFRAVMQVATDIFSSEGDFWSTVRRNAWLGIAGFIATASAWIWSLITGLSILHNAKERERKPPPIPC